MRRYWIVIVKKASAVRGVENALVWQGCSFSSHYRLSAVALAHNAEYVVSYNHLAGTIEHHRTSVDLVSNVNVMSPAVKMNMEVLEVIYVCGSVLFYSLCGPVRRCDRV